MLDTSKVNDMEVWSSNNLKRKEKKTLVMFKCNRKYEIQNYKKKKKKDASLLISSLIRVLLILCGLYINNCNILLKCTVHPLLSLFPFPILRDPTSFVVHSCISLVCKEITDNL